MATASRAVVFLRRGPVGHVGWAFEYPDGSWNVGAVENPHHTWLTPARRMGWWTSRVKEPLAPMRDHHYDVYKVIRVHNAHAASAEQKTLEVREHPFEIVGANCEDDVYQILTAFGAQLPSPAHPQNWTPMAWFKHPPGEEAGISAPLQE
jgi:hypothetical protein